MDDKFRESLLCFLIIVVNTSQISAAFEEDLRNRTHEAISVFGGKEHSYPYIYRFTFNIKEMYDDDLRDRQSLMFQELSSRIKGPIENIYQNAPGTYSISVISLEPNSDPSKIVVTVDVAAKGFMDSDVLENLLHSSIKKQQLGDLSIADPNDFRFEEFPAGSNDFCGENEFQCDSGQCIESDKRCDQTNDCNDGTDEDSCYYVPQTTEITPRLPPGTTTLGPFTTTATSNTTPSTTPPISSAATTWRFTWITISSVAIHWILIRVAAANYVISN